jgi:iron complex transport system ATP-binding protein
MMIGAQELRFSYPGAGREALSGMSLEAGEGSVLAVLGPNGCGKSTLLRLLLGMERPSSGRVIYGGLGLEGLSRREIAQRAAFLPQFERLGFALSAVDYVLLGSSPRVGALSTPSGAELDRARCALERAGAADLAERKVNELSGGELQLVRISRCLAQDTGAILLDEPTSMLDPAHSRLVADLLLGLAREGKTIVLSTHDAALAAYAAARAVLMREGREVSSGPAREVLEPARLEACFGVAFGQAAAPSAFAPRPDRKEES